MTSKKFTALLVYLTAAIHVSANTDSTFFSNFKPVEESSLFLFTAGYRMPVNKASVLNSGHGVYLEAGINPGHLISKKLIIGLYAGWAWKDKLWSTSFNNAFIEDYRSSINSESHFSSLDSTVINASANVFASKSGRSLTLPGCEMQSFHNYSFYYGAMLRLPYKYIPTVKLYMGITGSYILGSGDLITKQNDYSVFQLKRALYGCEVILFRGFQAASKSNTKFPVHKNICSFSVYYETYDFYNSSLYFFDGEQRTNIPLKRFLSSSFLQKYKNENAWGFKVSFAIM
jgi:hypothetical protein